MGEVMKEVFFGLLAAAAIFIPVALWYTGVV